MLQPRLPPVFALLFGLLATCAQADIQVQARFDPAGETWSLDYCRPEAEAGSALRLRAPEAAATEWLDTANPAPDVRGGRTLAWRAAPACVHLRFPLGRIADRNSGDEGYRAGSDLLSWAWTWWYQPVEQQTTRLTLDLPAGWHFSTPWPHCSGDSAGRCLVVGATPWHWPAVTVLGRQPARLDTVPGGRIHGLVIGNVDPAQRATLDALPRRAGDLISAAYGRLPVPDLQLLVIPIRSRGRGDAVVFGQVNRGGLGGVHLLVNAAGTAADFDEDWVLPHELSHLLHPYLGDERGRWLSEGLASYYQNLLRSRTGRMTPEHAWERLFAGFDRGRAQVNDDTLDDIASNMHRSHAYMRVYWSGAAFWFKVDVALRQRGHPGLDRLLDRFGREHLPATQTWQPRRFLAALDAQLESPFLAELADDIGGDTQFPDVDDEIEALGLHWSNGAVGLLPGREATLREAMAGRSKQAE